METKKRLIFLEDAVEKIANTPTKVIQKAFFTPGMLDILADRQFEIIDMLEYLPTVDAVEVVHGQWNKFHWGSFDFVLRSRCSNCSCVVYEYGFNYCPYCGAKMDGDGNG